jgi:hypothetical protein
MASGAARGGPASNVGIELAALETVGNASGAEPHSPKEISSRLHATANSPTTARQSEDRLRKGATAEV